MILLALDASTTAVGWALFDGPDYVDSGVYVPKGEDWVDRVMSIGAWLYDSELEYDDLAFELATGNKGNMHTNRLLGAVEYEIRQFCRIHEIAVHTVTASQVKATGCHKLAISVAGAIAVHPMNGKHPGDEADAIGVALAMNKMIREQERER